MGHSDKALMSPGAGAVPGCWPVPLGRTPDDHGLVSCPYIEGIDHGLVGVDGHFGSLGSAWGTNECFRGWCVKGTQ